MENAKERNVAIVHNIQKLSENDVLLIIGAAHIDDLWGLLISYVQPKILKNSFPNGNKAMVSGPGGIDFDSNKMNLQVKMDSRFRGNDNGRGGNDNGRGGNDNGRGGNDSEGDGNDNGRVGNNNGIQFHIDSAMLQQLKNAPGFVPVIINIQPLKSLPDFLGIRETTGNSQGMG